MRTVSVMGVYGGCVSKVLSLQITLSSSSARGNFNWIRGKKLGPALGVTTICEYMC